jgi:hypothetical protein
VPVASIAGLRRATTSCQIHRAGDSVAVVR